jgi:hypothetical protein
MSLTVAPEVLEFFSYVAIAEVEETITLHQRGRVKFMATYLVCPVLQSPWSYRGVTRDMR